MTTLIILTATLYLVGIFTQVLLNQNNLNFLLGNREGEVEESAMVGRTGQEQWAYQGNTLLSLNLSAADGMVYLVELAGSVTSLDAGTGAKVWELEGFSAYNDPVFICDGQVYFGTTDGTIHTVSAKTGEKNWEFKVLSGINTYPSVYDGVLYVGSSDGHVYALKGASADSNPLQQ